MCADWYDGHKIILTNKVALIIYIVKNKNKGKFVKKNHI